MSQLNDVLNTSYFKQKVLRKSLLKYGAELAPVEISAFIEEQEKKQHEITSKPDFHGHPMQDSIQYHGNVLKAYNEKLSPKYHALMIELLDELNLDYDIRVLDAFNMDTAERQAEYIYSRLRILSDLFTELDGKLGVPKYE